MVVEPISAGLGTIKAPAFSKDLTFDDASASVPVIIAPACPIRLPGGAVWPTISDITGFVTSDSINYAASCSLVPPISPIITIASVELSFSNKLSTSTKSDPLTGSPPIPTQVDCPMPNGVNWPTAS